MIQELRSTVESGSRKNNAKAVIARVPAPAYRSADPMPRRTATAPQAALPTATAPWKTNVEMASTRARTQSGV